MQNLMVRKKLTKSEQNEILIFNLISALFLIACISVFINMDSISNIFGDAKYALPMFFGVLYMAFVIYDLHCSIHSYYFFYDDKIVIHNRLKEVDFLYSNLSSFSEKEGTIYLNLKNGRVHKIYSEEIDLIENELSNKLQKISFKGDIQSLIR